jgi:hypothetical protein
MWRGFIFTQSRRCFWIPIPWSPSLVFIPLSICNNWNQVQKTRCIQYMYENLARLKSVYHHTYFARMKFSIPTLS